MNRGIGEGDRSFGVSDSSDIDDEQQLQAVLRQSLIEYQQSCLGSSSTVPVEATPSFNRFSVPQFSEQYSSRNRTEEAEIQAAIQLSINEQPPRPTVAEDAPPPPSSTLPEIESAFSSMNFANLIEHPAEEEDITDLLHPLESQKHNLDRFSFQMETLDTSASTSTPSMGGPFASSVKEFPHGANASRGGEERPEIQMSPEASAASPFAEMHMMEMEEVQTILEVIFGYENTNVNEDDITRWFNHRFYFSDSISWGLLQSQGGPCGVLAAVQGWMLRSLFFKRRFYTENTSSSFLPSFLPSSSSSSPPTAPSGQREKAARGEAYIHDSTERENTARLLAMEKQSPPFAFAEEEVTLALIEAMCAILYQCTPTSHYKLVFMGVTPLQRPHNPPVVSRKLVEAIYRDFHSIQSVFQFLTKYPFVLEASTSVISFVCSVIATRGIQKVCDDMDDPQQSMVGLFGHCSQELVNLLLTGRATSNVFDGDQTLGEETSTSDASPGLIFGGISKRPAIGFLSELESLRYMEVGQFYKHPYFPVWVIGGSDHYTTLFSPDIRVSWLSAKDVAEQEAKKAFTRFDAGGEKIVPSHLLRSMLKECELAMMYEEARQALDSDCNVILFREFVEWVTQKKLAQPGYSGKEPPKQMFLYLYNGQDPPGPSLHCFLVELTDISKPYAQSDASYFSRLLWTRWPNCIVTELNLDSKIDNEELDY